MGLSVRARAGASLLLAGLLGWPWAAVAQSRVAPLEVVIQSGHLEEIRDVAYSPDGCYVATAGADNRAKLWDETTGLEIRSFRGGNAAHRSLAFSPDGSSLFVGVAAGAATRWRVADRAREREYGAAISSSIALDADGRLMAVTGGDSSERRRDITVWNASTGELLGTYGWYGTSKPEAEHIGAEHAGLDHLPNTVALAPDGQHFATTGDEGRTALWHVGAPAPLRFYGEGKDPDDDADFFEELREDMARTPRTAVAFDPEDGRLASAVGTVGYVRPIAAEAPSLALRGHRNAITEIAFSEDGRFIATGSTTGEVRVWDAATGRDLATLQAHAGVVNAVAFKPVGDGVRCKANLPETADPLSGRLLVTAGEDNTARIWSLGGAQAPGEDGSPGGARLIRALSPRVQPLNDAAFSAAGTELALASAAAPHGSLKLWNLSSGYEVRSFPLVRGGVNAVAFSPDDRMIATAGLETGAIVWDAGLLEPIDIVPPPERPRWLRSLGTALSVFALTSESGITFVGNSGLTGALNTTDFLANRGARALAFDRAGRYLAMGGNETRLWDVRARRLLGRDFDDDSIDDLAFTPDGEILVSAGGLANAREVATGDRIERYARRFFGTRNSPHAVAVHPDGARIAFGHSLGRVDIRELESGDTLAEVETGASVHSVAFSNDGSVLVTGDAAGVLRVLDVESGLRTLTTMEAHTDAVLAARFSPDGRMLVTASSDGTARLWDATSWREIVAFVSIGSDDYVILTPDNYYAASTNGHYGVAFRRGNTLYPFEQFDLRLNRPDVVFERLGTIGPELLEAYRGAYRKRLARMNLTPAALDADDALRPVAEIRDLPPRVATSERTLAFTVVAEDRASPLRSINVWVNDVPLYGSAGHVLDEEASRMRHPVELELSEGRNKIQVSAVNARGVESLRTTIETIYEPLEDRRHDLYVVAVGVSDYGDPRVNLTYAEKDARDLVAAFERQERFENIHRFPILGADATRQNILAVRAALERTGVDDEVVLFVAGHGLLDDDLNYYFATPDVDFADPARRGVSYSELEGLLDGIPARRKLLLMDTCYSGEVDRSADAAGGPGPRGGNGDADGAESRGAGTTRPGASAVASADAAALAEGVVVRSVRGIQPSDIAPQMTVEDSFHLMQEIFANLGRGSGAVVIAAAGGDEFAFEGPETSNGVFTYSVLKAIENALDPGETGTPYLRLSQLREHVVTRVRTLTGGRQTPSIRRVNLDFDYPVFSLHEPELTDVPPIESRDFGQLLIEAAEQSLAEP